MSSSFAASKDTSAVPFNDSSSKSVTSVTSNSVTSNATGNKSFRSGSWFDTSNSSRSGSRQDNNKGASHAEPVVARREQKAVSWSKLLVFLVLLLAATAVGTATYLIVQEQEEADFENHFEGYASEIVTVARQKADQLFSALETLSVVISSEADKTAQFTNTTWPFVTIDDWSVKAEKVTELIGATDPYVVFAPVVEERQKGPWSGYVQQTAGGWYRESIMNEEKNATVGEMMGKTIPFIHDWNQSGSRPSPIPVPREGIVVPVWQTYPLQAPNPRIPVLGTNFDLLSAPRAADLFYITREILGPTIGFTQVQTGEATQRAESQLMQPIYQGVDTDADDRSLVGVAWIRIGWIGYFENLLVEGINGITVVLRSSCPRVVVESEVLDEDEVGVLSYQIDGPNATFLGEMDVHDTKYDHLEVTKVLVDLDVDISKLEEGQCVPKLSLHLYPTEELEESFHSTDPLVYAMVVVVIFVFTSMVFILYDYFVGQRQTKVMDRIVKQDKIVSNVFPTAIRERLYQGVNNNTNNPDHSQADDLLDPMDFETQMANSLTTAPLADLFLNTSIVFADIAGFTAWSSAREPQQVFMLLESIYGTFDKIAYHHNVFKVETVGDCYVGVAGLPEPNEQHALAVAKFARDCLKKMRELTLKLEVSLGPDTGALDLRVGIHSGQVTAGVLRGERSRFQLFGDTMNTASRMESSAERNRIQLSQATADLLIEAGWSKYIEPRKGKILVRGKGEMQTYWLRTRKPPGKKVGKMKSDLTTLDESADGSTEEEDVSSSAEDEVEFSGHESSIFDTEGVGGMTKTQRLVEWNVEVLTSLLQQIIASRDGVINQIASLSLTEGTLGKGATVLEEFVPIIPLKRFNEADLRKRRRPSTIDIGEEAKSELRNYLSNIADMYQEENPFHNFEHASHVTASVKKLLKRIVNVNQGHGLGPTTATEDINLIDLAGHSYGITSDPLTQFAVVFSAIIHDVDHPGVPNAQLVKEDTRNAQIYKKSVAEQNSVELAWEMLMGTEYKTLRACIYQTEEELCRFRQLVVNTVMATDIVDRDLQALRKNRWETAFKKEPSSNTEKDADSEDRKATIVIEHLIQASDVSHTMQHWHIYKQWNEKFFMECYGAYKAGRAESDPSINWYKGEIGFFDFYVIPLAKKLDDCGVFGVASHEYMNYAKANRAEWEREGENLVQAYLAKYEEDYQQ